MIIALSSGLCMKQFEGSKCSVFFSGLTRAGSVETQWERIGTRQKVLSPDF